MRLKLFLLFWLLLLPPRLALGADPVQTGVRTVQELQRIYRAPYNLVALRWVALSESEKRTVCRSHNNPYGAPTSVAMIQVAGLNSIPETIITEAAGRLIQEYETGPHKLPAPLASKMRAEIEKALSSRDSRSIWYAIHSPGGQNPSERVAGTIRLYDATATRAEPKIQSPIEAWLKWSYPERLNETTASVDLQFAFKNSDPHLKQLESAGYLLTEAATYLDLFYVARGQAVTVRFVTTAARARLFRQRQYGFELDDKAPAIAKELMILKMDGAEFVKRFGSRWPVWKQMYELTQPPPNFLIDPRPLRQNVELRVRKAQRNYDCLVSLLQRGVGPVGAEPGTPPYQSVADLPSVEAYLDGRFEPVMSASETPLLF